MLFRSVCPRGDMPDAATERFKVEMTVLFAQVREGEELANSGMTAWVLGQVGHDGCAMHGRPIVSPEMLANA